MTVETLVKRLTEAGNKADLSKQYADAFVEYTEATENLQRNGAVCADPRTGKPIPNPYLSVRDKALAKMHTRGLRRVKAEALWQ